MSPSFSPCFLTPQCQQHATAFLYSITYFRMETYFEAVTAHPTAQVCIPSFMRRDMGCGFVSWHKGVEDLHVYLTLTIHLPLIQESREWINLIPSMTSTARQCWSISDHLFPALCAVSRTPGRVMEQWPPVCRAMGCAACVILSPLHPGPRTQCTPACVTVGHRSCWPGRISDEWVLEQYPLGSCINTAYEKVACHLLSLSNILLA